MLHLDNMKVPHTDVQGGTCVRLLGRICKKGINYLKKVSFDSIIDVVILYRFNCG